MPLFNINAEGAPPADLIAQANALPEGAPIIVMVHGYGFSPSDPKRDPHSHIFALEPSFDLHTATSWPRALGFGGQNPGEGLAIGFGWESTGRLARIYDMAEIAAQRLARLITQLSEVSDRPVGLIGHSMGCHVGLRALRYLHAGRVSRMVLLAAAEFQSRAEEAMASPAGRACEVLNVTTRENDLFDFLMELGVGRGRERCIGNGLSRPLRNWVDLQIDAPDVIATLADIGYPVALSDRRVCHFSCYMRDGLFDLYRAVLRAPERLPLPYLAQALPQVQAPRWSRLFARQRTALAPLPLAGHRAD
ncbi:alpha/beta fold hydrolase [uncultured Thioclava sp.]|uniref:Alpha/beta fold hydrolase n=1 Tax=Thioclava arctica TaxID=3238301 RepID=A0ABV3TI74_9RHOB|nr:alpha/beta fold hydrolase [uncultured Thioclava sp.]